MRTRVSPFHACNLQCALTLPTQKNPSVLPVCCIHSGDLKELYKVVIRRPYIPHIRLALHEIQKIQGIIKK